jgi:hypothetical protein
MAVMESILVSIAHSGADYLLPDYLRAPFRGIGGVHKHFWDFILENTMQ